MTFDEHRATLTVLGLTQNTGGELLGVDPRTSRKWANAERDIPPPASRFLHYLVHIGAASARVKIINDEFNIKIMIDQNIEVSTYPSRCLAGLNYL